jgi:CRP/FNR family transcriptional regulator
MSEKNLINNCENCENCWKNFQFLTKAELELINENRYEAIFKPGEIILKQGAPASNALFLAKGLARNYIEGIMGRNFIMEILQPGILILSPGAYVNSRHTYSVAAITQVNACFINFDTFRQLVRSNGDFAEGLVEDMSRKSLSSYQRMVNLTQKKMHGRIAEALLYFSDEVFRSDEFEMILSRQELGEFTNMVKESVIRILKEMEDSSIISVNCSRIKILDKEKLIEISEKG